DIIENTEKGSSGREEHHRENINKLLSKYDTFRCFVSEDRNQIVNEKEMHWRRRDSLRMINYWFTNARRRTENQNIHVNVMINRF
ncbi:hypothetical protein PIROE2DRAFT_10392, partial [Piromyces sp. E2]